MRSHYCSTACTMPAAKWQDHKSDESVFPQTNEVTTHALRTAASQQHACEGLYGDIWRKKCNSNCRGSVSLVKSSTSKYYHQNHTLLIHSQPSGLLRREKRIVHLQGRAPNSLLIVDPSIGRQSVACTKPILRGRAPYQGLHSPFAPPNRLSRRFVMEEGSDGFATGNDCSLVLIDLAASIW